MFDRVQAANTVGTVAMLLLAVMGFLNGRPEFLDLAIVYGLLNVIGTIAVLKYFRHGDLGDPGEPTRSAATMNALDRRPQLGLPGRRRLSSASSARSACCACPTSTPACTRPA